MSERWRGKPQRLEVKVLQKTEMDPRKGKGNIISPSEGTKSSKKILPEDEARPIPFTVTYGLIMKES